MVGYFAGPPSVLPAMFSRSDAIGKDCSWLTSGSGAPLISRMANNKHCPILMLKLKTLYLNKAMYNTPLSLQPGTLFNLHLTAGFSRCSH